MAKPSGLILPRGGAIDYGVVLRGWRNYGVAILFGVMFVALTVATDTFLTTANLQNLLEQSSLIGLIACGATVVILAGEFDLSAGAIYSFVGIIAVLVANETTVGLGLLAGFMAGGVIGLANGALVTRLGMDSFLATLASGFVLVGLGIIVTDGAAVVRSDDPGFNFLGRGETLSLKYEAYTFVGVTLLVWVILRATRFGKQIYAVGGSSIAARIAGVRVDWVRTMAFVIGGFTAAAAGVLEASELRVARADGGVPLILPAIAAVVIGGTSVAGGRGGVWRTMIGVLFVSLIGNGFNLLRINTVYESLFTGGIIVIAVALDSWSRRVATR